MKKELLIKIKSAVTSLVFIALLLGMMSFITPKNKFSKTLSASELSVLTEKALKDPIFLAITQQDVDRMVSGIFENSRPSKEQWQELADKKQWTKSEAETIFAGFGFKGSSDLLQYVELIKSLDKKLGMDPKDEKNYSSFREALAKKQRDYIEKNALFEKAYKTRVTKTGGMPPECWKCVYDYRDCMNSTGFYAIKYRTVTYYRTDVDLVNGNYVVTSTSFTSPSFATITYVNSSYTQSGCFPYYKSCIGSCMN